MHSSKRHDRVIEKLATPGFLKNVVSPEWEVIGSEEDRQSPEESLMVAQHLPGAGNRNLIRARIGRKPDKWQFHV